MLPKHAEVAIVGAGFSGLAMAAELRRRGRTDFVILEKADGVGGTWRHNTYPGCGCDVPSHLYSFAFAPNPTWTNTYSLQPEIRDYIEGVAKRSGLADRVITGCELVEASWTGTRWRLETSLGEMTADHLVAATGPLHEPALPDTPGLAAFAGRTFHSAAWDHAYDLTGRRVAVVGTGASAIQFVPQIQPQVASLHLFQRTPAWIVPKLARPLSHTEHRLYARLPAAQRAMRGLLYAGRELFALPLLHARWSGRIRSLAMRHLERAVPDPELRAKLTPDYAPGCKRILVSNDFYPAVCRPNVELLTTGLTEVREHSVVGADGQEREVDAIIFATGFHVTTTPIATRVRGRDRRSLAELWQGSPEAYRGTTVSGYPNFYLMLGPNTGLGHTSVVLMAEAQARYIAGGIDHASRLGALEPRPEVQAAWNRKLQARMRGTVWTEGGCASWYLDARGRNSTLWPGFATGYIAAVRRFDVDAYVSPAPRPAPDDAWRIAA